MWPVSDRATHDRILQKPRVYAKTRNSRGAGCGRSSDRATHGRTLQKPRVSAKTRNSRRLWPVF
jgi:hypothetical protein